MGFVAGGATEAMDALVIRPAEAAGRALTAADGGRYGQFQSQGEGGQDGVRHEGRAALAASIGLRLPPGDEGEVDDGVLDAALAGGRTRDHAALTMRKNGRRFKRAGEPFQVEALPAADCL